MTLDYAIDDGQLLSRNPAGRTNFPPLRQASHTYLTTTEIGALAQVCGRQGDVVHLLAYTGMRFGELVGLRVRPYARRAGADLRLLQKTMGHASITVTAHVYADLYDDELDGVALALDELDDRPSD